MARTETQRQQKVKKVIAPLAYLKKELNFTMREWSELSESDKETLRQWAREEIELLKI